MDIFSLEKRSEVMSKIRSKWTSIECGAHDVLKGHKIRHLMHPKLLGSPDIYLKDYNCVIFIDGCFWHKCPEHYRQPKSNKKYWIPKIETNVKRDRKNRALLRKQGFKVVRLWEHSMRKDKHYILKVVEKCQK